MAAVGRILMSPALALVSALRPRTAQAPQPVALPVARARSSAVSEALASRMGSAANRRVERGGGESRAQPKKALMGS